MLDTNACLDLFVFDDPQCTSLLAAVRASEIELITREDCRAEWRAVLAYRRLKLNQEQRTRAADVFDRWVHCVSSANLAADAPALPRCRDRDDQKFIELAYQADAVALLTRDDELLRLARRAKRDFQFAILPPALWREALSG
ncbi:putative toxin-antitoxin system toxin component, PIN family [Dyella monticola]|uniref:Putative toxin-antitoxin system toxin component, PIN family n=1 Tax=Dyella monticola TaxID=1927958 RepID=A0A370X439_9GAMM|nr:putative toxin-antitoxin system toxin component, PIN family [Dyella monticola]RDS83158.1 putative toxin-antitoxin system toxin component, PIN family [Dyella monticola]